MKAMPCTSHASRTAADPRLATLYRFCTDEISTIGLWGPVAREVLSSITSDDVSGEGFGMLSCREIPVNVSGGGVVKVLASRISYVGELGWELYVAMSDAAALWEALLEAQQNGRAHV